MEEWVTSSKTSETFLSWCHLMPSHGVCSTGFSATFHQDIGGTPWDHFGRFKDGSEACCDLWSGDDYTDRETGGLKTICLSFVYLSFPILNLWFSFFFRLHYFSTLFVSLKHQKPKPAFSVILIIRKLKEVKGHTPWEYPKPLPCWELGFIGIRPRQPPFCRC